MSAPDTPIDAATVEALATRLLTPAVEITRGYCDIDLPLDPLRELAAATLRALLAERDALATRLAAAEAENARLNAHIEATARNTQALMRALAEQNAEMRKKLAFYENWGS